MLPTRNATTSDALARHSQLIVPIAATSGVILSSSVTVAWLFDAPNAMNVFLGLVAMKFNTVLCLALCAGSLALQARAEPFVPHYAAARTLAGIALIIGLATLVEYAFDIDLPIDKAATPADAFLGWPDIMGRMGINTALTISFCAGALFMRRSHISGARRLAQSLAICGLAVAYVAVIGYIFSTAALTGVSPYSHMALHTAIAFALLAFGILLVRLDNPIAMQITTRHSGGTITRCLLPLIGLGVPLSGYIVAYGQRQGAYDTSMSFALFTLVTMIVLSGFVVASADRLTRAEVRERETTEELRRSEERFREMVENSLQGIVIYHKNGKPLFVNSAYARMAGYSRAEILALSSIDALLPPDDIERAHQMRRDAARSSEMASTVEIEPVVTEIEGMRRDGVPFWGLLHLREVVWENAPAIQATIIDISRRKSVEHQLMQAQKLDAIGQLTGGIAHDFNNLLTVILVSLEFARAAAEGETRDHIADALSAGERASALTQRLLAFSRRQVLKPVTLDIAAVVEDMEDLLRRTLDETIEIDLVTPKGLWSALADSSQAENVILNLAINARDAMPRGGRLTVEVDNAQLDRLYANANSGVNEGDYVVVTVSDTGAGMSPEVLERVFEPFFTTKAFGKGTGLGLSMVYGFARQSGGHVKIYSELGVGTTVRLYLPRTRGLAAAQSTEAVQVPLPAGQGQRILVVEDDANVRSVAVSILTDLGYTVFTASNAYAALRELERRDPIDLVFTDVVMPGGMSARELAEEARRTRPDLKVLFASGYTADTIAYHGQLDDDVDFISKPYRPTELAHAIQQAFKRAS